MSVSEATLKALKQLGLTEYEVQAYVTLVDGGKMAASDISTVSRVPFSRIYDVLGRLEARGFIQVSRGRPTQYLPKAPSEVMRLVRLAWEETLDSSTRVVVAELQPRFEREAQATSRDVWLLHGRAAILAKALEMVDGAREELMLSVPTIDTEQGETSIAEDLSALVERLLTVRIPKVRVLTSGIPGTLLTALPSCVQVRVREKVFGGGLIADRLMTLIMLAGTGSGDSLLGIYASAPVFADMAVSYFDRLWNESAPL
ncbi:MAG: TrmB family transcriptional regulator [Candidatus Thorarchaeota archaeon]|nr:TrmB family transcriptional regulator [Candidatus Thorarchaeota archaeon]